MVKKRSHVLVSIVMSLTLVSAGLAVPSSPAIASTSAKVLAILKAEVLYHQQTGSVTERDKALDELTAGSNFVGGLWRDFVEAWDAVSISTTAPEIPTSGHTFVVLGSALKANGKMSSKFERRLNVVLPLLQANPTSKCIVSGGAPKKGQTEAKVGRAWLISKGIPSGQIITETKSASTVGNATRSMAILRDKKFTSYTLVSDYSHLKRAAVLFNAAQLALETKARKKLGITAVGNVAYPDKTKNDPESTIVSHVRTLLKLPGVFEHPDGFLLAQFSDGKITTLSGGTFTVDLASSLVSVTIKNKTWSGKALKPKVTVKVITKYHTKVLKAGTDYKVSYQLNMAIGTGKATITGKGKYQGKTTVNFTISPKNTKVKSLTAGIGTLTVKWSKVSTKQKVTEYQINYRVKNKGSWNTITVPAQQSSVVIPDLEKGSKYEVKIVTRKELPDKTYSSGTSASKTSKVIR